MTPQGERRAAGRGGEQQASATDAVAPDGSPVAVFAALPPLGDDDLVADALPAAATVLDLGCGAGRIANALSRRGHRVVGVDESQAMLARLRPGVEAIHARIGGLDLERRFAGVVLAGHLVNTADVGERAALLETCRRHVARGGAVFVQRYDPDWAARVDRQVGALGPVLVDWEVCSRDGAAFVAEVRYLLEGWMWMQTVAARVLDDEELAAALDAVGLRPDRWLDARRRWVRAVAIA